MAPPTEPIEVRVMKAIAERLATIEPGKDYWSKPVTVTRSLRSNLGYAPEEMPVLGVMRTSGSRYIVEGPFEHELQVAIHGYVRGDHPGDPGAILAGDKLAFLREDVRRCLLGAVDGGVGDPTLGGLVEDLRPDPEAPIDTDDGALEPEAYFRQTWRVLAHAD